MTTTNTTEHIDITPECVWFSNNRETLNVFFTCNAEIARRITGMNAFDVVDIPEVASVVDEFPNGYASVPRLLMGVVERREERRQFWNNGGEEFQPKTQKTWFRCVA